jgi:hypothetical protein
MEFTEIPVQEAQRLAQGRRMDPAVQTTITKHLHHLEPGKAWCIMLNEEEQPRRTVIKGQIERLARNQQLNIGVQAIGRDKLVCWKLTPEEERQRRARATRIRAAQEARKAGVPNIDQMEEELATSPKRR